MLYATDQDLLVWFDDTVYALVALDAFEVRDAFDALKGINELDCCSNCFLCLCITQVNLNILFSFQFELNFDRVFHKSIYAIIFIKYNLAFLCLSFFFDNIGNTFEYIFSL
jgi:hypothetical protein